MRKIAMGTRPPGAAGAFDDKLEGHLWGEHTTLLDISPNERRLTECAQEYPPKLCPAAALRFTAE